MTALQSFVRILLPPKKAFERPVTPYTSARGQRAIQPAPAARWEARRAAAQFER
jgi:hypothetical protein